MLNIIVTSLFSSFVIYSTFASTSFVLGKAIFTVSPISALLAFSVSDTHAIYATKLLTIFPLSLLVDIICPVFKFSPSKNSLFIFEKSFTFKVSSKPSILYDTIPLLLAFIYSAPEFNSFSYELLSSMSFFKYDPLGLNSPAILAFLVI